MNYVRRQDKPFRAFAAFMAAMVVLTLAAAVAAQAQTYNVLYNFGSNPKDPLQPRGPDAIAQGRDGDLYTTSANGGANNNGTVFKVTPSGTVTVVSNLGSPGDSPLGGVTLGTDGNFYGTTEVNGEGPGTAFKVTPAGVETGLHIFGNTGDGACPYAAPIEGADGNYYGTTTTVCGFGSQSTVYRLTSAGVLTTLHTFTDGSNVTTPLVQGADGNFYGVSESGGTSNDGVIFKMSSSGVVTVLHNFTGTDGSAANGLIQASDGNFYGVASTGGSANAGVVFKVTPSGTYTVLHDFNGSTDGNGPTASLVQATDGKLYGVAHGGSSNLGTTFSITTSGTFTVLVSFDGTNGSTPNSPLKQNTNGVLYGDTYQGGDLSLCSSSGCGVFYSLNIGAKPFVSLQSTSGKVGSKVGVFGQGFSSSSVVKFNGVQATTITLAGTTYITATVPMEASSGHVTVTTGSTMLTSSQQFTVHNSWSIGKAMPTARFGAFAGASGANIYVVGGATNSGYQVTNVNEIYNTQTNTWKTGASDPTARELGASAVVNGILYVIGGSTSGSNPLTLVEAYNPVTNTWATKAPMPTARNSMPAVVDKDVIYVIGGYDPNTQVFYDVVESYNTTTDTWTEEKPLPVATAWEAVGLLGSTVVAADGQISPGTPVGSNEGYNPTTNTWAALTADATPRLEACFAAINGQLYVAGGANATGVLSVNEAYNANAKAWTTLASMPNALATAGSATAGGRLYCFGGFNSNLSSVYSYLQIYQP
jgi:uncharacterized repeat protein (TIGR03803 family)